MNHPCARRTDRQTDGRNCDSICALTAYAVARKNTPKPVWRPGSARTRWGSLSAPRTPGSLAALRGWAPGKRIGREEGRGRKEWEEEGIGEEGRKVKRGKEVKGKGGLTVMKNSYFRSCTVHQAVSTVY